MPDSRFFHHAGALSLEAVAALTGARPECGDGHAPDPARQFSDVAPLHEAQAEHISFLENVKYLEEFSQSRAGACFVHPKYAPRAPRGMVCLITDEPYFAYALAARQFYPDIASPGISERAVISANAVIGKDCTIGAGVVIEDGVIIGDGCRIGANCTLSHCILGNRVTLHRGVHIGQDGFGFAPGKRGVAKVPQLGRVLIGNDVEIGSGTCIDRGAGPDTLIGDHTKIDNLVQIGHNVQIGKYVFIAAQCGISGSTRIGDSCMLGGQVGIAGHLNIGRGVRIAAQSGVMTDIPDGATYGGGPAIPVRDWHRQTATLARLAKTKDKD